MSRSDPEREIARLIDERDRLQTILASVGAGLCVFDAGRRLVFANTVARTLLHLDETTLPGRSDFPDEPRVPEPGSVNDGLICTPYDLLTALPVGLSAELRVMRLDGQTFPASCVVSPIVRPEGIQGWTVALVDQSARRRADELVRLQSGVTEILARSEAETDAIYRVLRLLAERLGCALINYLTPRASGEASALLEQWIAPDLVEVPSVRRLLRLPCRLDDDGAGLAVRRGTAVCVPAVPHENPERSRLAAAHAAGLPLLLAIPVRHGEDHFGVIEAFFRTGVPPPDDLLELLGTIGEQLGDVIVRQRAEFDHRNEHEILRRITEGSQDPIIVQDREGRLLLVNEAAAALVGETPESVAGRALQEFVDPGLAADLFREDAEVAGLRTPRRYERDVTLRGRRFHFSTLKLPFFDRDDKVVGLISISRDMSEMKRNEDALRQAVGETERLLASISSVLIGVDAAGCVFRWNSMAEEVFGIPGATQIGRSLAASGIRWAEDEVNAAICECRVRRTAVRIERLPFRRRDGSDGTLSLSVNPVQLDASAGQGVLILATDSTEHHLLTAQLAQAQRLEAIGQLAAGIAHEINTPTQFIGDNVRFLRDAWVSLEPLTTALRALSMDPDVAAAAPDRVATIRRLEREADIGFLDAEMPGAIEETLGGVERVAAIVRAMKEFSHPGSSDRVAIDLNQALASTLVVSRNEWKYVADVETDFAPDLPLVPCLAGEMNQVFLNVLVNAAHAIRAVVGEHPTEKGRIHVTTRVEGDEAAVVIEDSGTGMPPEVMARIFEPFFTTKEVGKGTGQGLALAHAVVVKKHRGRIDVESAPGQGTTFTIRLPLVEAAATEGRAA